MSQCNKSVYSTDAELERLKNIREQTAARQKLFRERSEQNKSTNNEVRNKTINFPGKSIFILFSY